MMICLYQFPKDNISHCFKLLPYALAICIKLGAEKPLHILQHDCFWLALPDQAQGLRKQIATVFISQLLSGNGKGRTRNTARKQVDAPKHISMKVVNILLDHIPMRPVV